MVKCEVAKRTLNFTVGCLRYSRFAPRSRTRRFNCGIRGYYSMLTARAASNAMISSEISDCNIIKIFAQRVNTGTSVGEKAVLVLKARNK
jgi:hypothetical protein